MTEKKRLFTIQELATLAGVSTSALRAWERRHDFFRPDRTPAGHRLYTSDDLKLFWFVSHLRSEGWDLRRISALGRDELLEQANQYFSAHEEPTPTTAGRKTYDVILEALAANDFDGALLGLEKLYTVTESNLAFSDLCLELMVQVGEAWHRGVISIAAEHTLTARLKHLLLGLLYMRGSAEFEDSAPTVVCACLPGELHEIGLLRVSIYLREWGFKVSYIGGNTPLQALQEHVTQAKPAFVCVSVTRAMPPEILLRNLERLNDEVGSRVPTVVGGSGLLLEIDKKSQSLSNLSFIESMEDLEAVSRPFLERGLQSTDQVRT
ncbi:MAG: MerR family transcriptional regulator [Silvanigrellales bacterium]|jgi:methanogenic corrinoid protein MtbC1|nr:MerR family transcriptional regulator [Silvanigrellales bacterium]